MTKFTILVFGLLFQAVMAQTTEIEKTTICWDTSFSMLERDLDKEFELLGTLFKRTPDQDIQLLLFNLNVEEHQIKVRNGDWKDLRDLLINVVADGATRYRILEPRIKNETVYIFTDGNSLVADDVVPVKKGNTIINTLLGGMRKCWNVPPYWEGVALWI